jgi:hypothetical protein
MIDESLKFAKHGFIIVMRLSIFLGALEEEIEI